MNYRTFPKIPQLELSQFGMGLMRLPVLDGDNSKIDYDTAAKMVDAAIEGGVNYFDTAHPYHGGDSQRFAAKYIVPRLKKEGLHLATKMPQWETKTYDDYEKMLDKQMDILGVEQIEFYLIHALGNESWKKHKAEGIIDFMKKAVESGKIKYPCFSFHGSYDTFVDIIDSYDGWIFTQLQINYIDDNWQAGLKGMKYAHSKDIGVIIMEPLKGGLLVNNLPPAVEKMYKDNNVSPVEAAMKWCYCYKEPTVVLSGVSSIEQTKGQIEIANKAKVGGLSQLEKEIITYAKENFNIIPCSSCEYCQPCPADVTIPSIISAYNNYVVFGRENGKTQYQEIVKQGHGADRCTECGACEAICPQSIGIIEVLKAAHEKMSV